MTALAEVRRSAHVIDGAAAAQDLALDADVCVIGSGAGGAMVAAELAQKGIGILLVEEGGYYTHADFTMDEGDVYPKLYQEAAQRATADAAISILQGRAVGGTTVVNWTTSFRTPEHVVDHWRKYFEVKGFSFSDLASHWDFTEKRLCMTQVPEAAINKNNRKLLEGARALGWQADTIKRNVHACLNSGYCGMGCPYNAKRSALVTLVPDAIDAGARLLFRCRVDRLRVAAGRAEAAEGTLLDATGLEARGRVVLRAKRFVLAGGAINSPALLLRSGIDDGGLVGARTFLHPVVASGALYDEPIEAFYGAPQSVASHAFGDRGEQVGMFFEAAPMHPVLAASSLAGFGASHAALLEKLSHFATHLSLTIDGFHEESVGGRVKLRASGAPVLDYPISGALWEAFRFGQKRLAELQLASGAKRVITLHEPPGVVERAADVAALDALPWRPGSVAIFTAHQMGGCAMGDDPRRAVVRSEDLRHHHLMNVHVIDGSVFPTGLGVNPQLSIYGLARLMATRLAAQGIY